eukprot:GHVQ01020442.1.p1 GENE.GHVQ01020442.1~~GHVQ01020442.1.p1  ORF type:complete len:115 (+),score=1.56 GHVQ01020442.1:561-905(+)
MYISYMYMSYMYISYMHMCTCHRCMCCRRPHQAADLTCIHLHSLLFLSNGYSIDYLHTFLSQTYMVSLLFCTIYYVHLFIPLAHVFFMMTLLVLHHQKIVCNQQTAHVQHVLDA